MWKVYLFIGFVMTGCHVGTASENKSKDYLKNRTAFTQNVEPLSKGPKLDDCLKLEVSEMDIRTIISQSKRVDGPEWHRQHVYPSCRFIGQIEYEGSVVQYTYYPTGYLTLEGYEEWFMCYDCSVNPDWVEFEN